MSWHYFLFNCIISIGPLLDHGLKGRTLKALQGFLCLCFLVCVCACGQGTSHTLWPWILIFWKSLGPYLENYRISKFATWYFAPAAVLRSSGLCLSFFFQIFNTKIKNKNTEMILFPRRMTPAGRQPAGACGVWGRRAARVVPRHHHCAAAGRPAPADQRGQSGSGYGCHSRGGQRRGQQQQQQWGSRSNTNNPRGWGGRRWSICDTVLQPSGGGELCVCVFLG